MTDNSIRYKKDELAIFDIVKLLLSFFVVCIHTGVNVPIPGIDLYLMQGLFRVAVPFFFFLAGYFLFNKIPEEKFRDDKNRETVKQYIYRIVFMYVIWSLVYLVIAQIPGWIKNGVGLRDILIYIEYAVVRGDSYLHLWYLSSLYTGVFLIYITGKRLKLKNVFAISIFLFLVGLFLLPYYSSIKSIVEDIPILDSAYTLFNRFLGWPRCGVFFGFVFVALGAYLAERKIVFNRYGSLIGLIVSFVLSMIEITLVDRYWAWDSGAYGGLQLSHIPMVVFLFSFLMSFDNIRIEYAKEIRTVSTLIYLLHPAVMLIVEKIPFGRQIYDYPFVLAIVVFLLSIIVAVFWIKAEQFTVFRFLKKLR